MTQSQDPVSRRVQTVVLAQSIDETVETLVVQQRTRSHSAYTPQVQFLNKVIAMPVVVQRQVTSTECSKPWRFSSCSFYRPGH